MSSYREECLYLGAAAYRPYTLAVFSFPYICNELLEINILGCGYRTLRSEQIVPEQGSYPAHVISTGFDFVVFTIGLP